MTPADNSGGTKEKRGGLFDRFVVRPCPLYSMIMADRDESLGRSSTEERGSLQVRAREARFWPCRHRPTTGGLAPREFAKPGVGKLAFPRTLNCLTVQRKPGSSLGPSWSPFDVRGKIT